MVTSIEHDLQFNLGSGLILYAKRCANSQLLSIKDSFPVPKVPQFYIEKQNRWIDNPDHPDYREALSVKQASMSNSIYNYIIDNLLWTNMDFTVTKEWKKYSKFFTDDNIKEESRALKYLIITHDLEYELLFNLVLSEQLVKQVSNNIMIIRDDQDINTIPLRNALNTNIQIRPIFIGGTGIQLVHPVDEYVACHEAGLDWYDWYRNKYDLPFMAMTLALYRAKQVIEIHVNDVQQIESEKQAKKNK